MVIITELTTPTAARFFSKLEDIYPRTRQRYKCTKLKDPDYAALGVLRCISTAKSGHEFLQHHAELGGREEDVDLFFEALKSTRRLANLKSFNDELRFEMSRKVDDPFAIHAELKGYRFFAADGHYHKAACFDPKVKTSKGQQKIATGHFFRLNLGSHHLSQFDLCRPEEGKIKDHDAKAIQRANVEALRYQAKTGEKVVYFWDKACIDYSTWSKLKRRGIYFVSLEKSNSALRTISIENLDASDTRNEGILSDTIVGGTNHEALRRIVYHNPSDGKTYTYITNEMQLPAWAIVLGYKHRWDIEKVFDQIKNKMHEGKSWASSETAKEAQAQFLCLTHNLVLLLEEAIKSQEGIYDKVEEQKKKGRTKTRRNREGKILKAEENFINIAIQRATQRCARFFRWLRIWLYREAPWSEAMARLAHVWGCKN